MKLSELRQLTQLDSPLEGAQLQLWIHSKIREMGLDPNAIYQELEMSSRYVDTHRDISYHGANMHLHSHVFFELIYCCTSCDAEYLVGSERYRLQKGDIIFVPPGISHRPLLPERLSTPYERYVLWLSSEFMTHYAGLFPYPFSENQNRANLLRTGGTPWEFLGELFFAGVQEAEQAADGWEAVVVGNTIQLLTQIKRATDTRRSAALKAEAPELLDRITAYIEAHYAETLSLADLSRKFYVSSSAISHLFRQKMGVSVYRYVTQRRLIAAKMHIEKGALLESVAAQTGFADYSGFYRAFKQEFGISPRQYRNLQEAAKKSPR